MDTSRPKDPRRVKSIKGALATRSTANKSGVRISSSTDGGRTKHGRRKAHRSPPASLFYLKTAGTNPRFDRSGLDGAERFSTKQPCSGRCSRRILQPLSSPVFEGMCRSLEVGGPG